MPPGALFPLIPQGTSITAAQTRISLDHLHKRMQQTEGNASSIERQLNDVRTHLKTLREQVTLDGTAAFNLLDPDPLITHEVQEHDKVAHEQQVHAAFQGVEGSMIQVKRRVDQVQTELQISWMSLTTLQVQLNTKRHQHTAAHHTQALHERLENKARALEQLSGCYERLRHSFLDKEEEMRREKLHSTNTLKALSVTHRDLDLKLQAMNDEVGRVRSLSQQLQEWCVSTEAKAEEQAAELKQLRTDLASVATSLLHLMSDNQPTYDDNNENNNDNATTARQQQQEQQGEENNSMPSSLAPAKVEGCGADQMFEQMTARLDVLVKDLKTEKREQKKLAEEKEGATEALKCSKEGSGKRKLSEAFQVGSGCEELHEEEEENKALAEREKDFLTQKKTFLSGLRESFQRLRQREMVCMTLDRRILKVRLLLEHTQRGFVSSDYVSMKCKRQLEQAYKEVLHVQGDIESIKAVSNDHHHLDCTTSEIIQLAPAQTGNLAAVMQSSDIGMLRSELARQVEVNMKLKQQVGRLCSQAERAEGLVAVERFEVDKLQQQVQVVSEKLKQEARRLNESHVSAVRERESTIQRLREQLRVLHEEMSIAAERNEVLSVENDKLLSKLSGQDLDLLKLRNDNVCLVVEKIAFEGSARALQEKMSTLMSKLSETKQQWKRFVVYCETF